MEKKIKLLRSFKRTSGEHPEWGPYSFQEAVALDIDANKEIRVKYKNVADISGKVGQSFNVSGNYETREYNGKEYTTFVISLAEPMPEDTPQPVSGYAPKSIPKPANYMTGTNPIADPIALSDKYSALALIVEAALRKASSSIAQDPVAVQAATATMFIALERSGVWTIPIKEDKAKAVAPFPDDDDIPF